MLIIWYRVKYIIFFYDIYTVLFYLFKAKMEKTAPLPGKINISRLEKKYKRLVERAYNLRQSDDSLSDVLYFEAENVLTQLRLLRSNLLN